MPIDVELLRYAEEADVPAYLLKLNHDKRSGFVEVTKRKARNQTLASLSPRPSSCGNEIRGKGNNEIKGDNCVFLHRHHNLGHKLGKPSSERLLRTGYPHSFI